MADEPQNVEINAAVNVNQADDSNVSGVSVGQIHGKVNIFTDRPVRTPDRTAIQAYLQAIQVKSQANWPKDARLRPLWAQPFLVHPAGQAAGVLQRLDAAVDAAFSRAQQMDWPRSVVILAETGVGKTPALNSLFYASAHQALGMINETPSKRSAASRGGAPKIGLPLLAVLRDLHGDFLSLLAAGYNRFAPVPLSVKEVELLLDKYDCLLFLDGLDELPSNTFMGGVEVLRQFLDGHPRLKTVVTCRTASYHNQLGRTEALELDLLTDAQVSQVLGGEVYENLPVSLRPLGRYRSILEIIIRFDQDRNRFQSKGQLVERLVRQRCGLEEDSDVRPDIHPAIVEGLLEKLAFAMFKDHVPFLTERKVMETTIGFLDEWHESITWREAADALHKLGIFKRDDRRQWQFADRSTQAYFAAAAAIQNPNLVEPVLEEVSGFGWREMLEILVGIMDNPNPLLFELVDRDALVGAHLSRLARPPLDARLQHALLDTLIDQLGRETAEARAEIATFLSQNPLQDTKATLLDALRREWRSGVLLSLARALLPLTGVGRGERLEKRLRSDNLADRLDATIDLWRWHTLGPQAFKAELAGGEAQASATDVTEVELTNWRTAIEHRLGDIGGSDNQPELVRGLASIVLGCIGGDYARTTLLERWNAGNLPQTLGWCIAEGLAHINHPDVEQAALAIAGEHRKVKDPAREQQRVWAFYIIGYVGMQKKAAGLLFRSLKESRGNEKIRGYAADAISRLQPPGSRQRLEEALNSEADPWVLRKIVQALGRAGTVETLPVLEQYLRSGRVQIRQTVRAAIASIRRRYEML